ncbi:MAG: NAD(P)/FAD-dependent oxidoreductase [Fimbriimonas sp.]|nr:NAD(P)/FAD-dependent oxidoreductase [Fimbriimonas sp.]
MKCDVAIIGGGPSGTTVACLLRKYMPHLKVLILERESFPREHVGESLLPPTGRILNEIGAWEKIEEQNFPVKLGASLKWGATPDPFDFSFIPGQKYVDTARPARFEGQRTKTAFQVDRGVFDKILLDHALECGARVFEDAKVTEVRVQDGRVAELIVDCDRIVDGKVVAKHYVDASGVSGILRRALAVPVDSPTTLRNIAIYDYWQDAAWAKREGPDGTHIQIMSLGWGWLWFITIGNTRTSVGLVTPAEYFKQSGLSREEIYLKAVEEEPHIAELLRGARREYQLQADRDWSYIAEQIVGDNWFLAGDSSGFADPILSAGITLAMVGSRKVAYSILELERRKLDPAWIKGEYQRTQKQNILNHIRFADYWYSANKMFTDLQDYCMTIAEEAGLTLSAEEAFRWIGSGGFTDDTWDPHPAAGTYRISAVKRTVSRFSGSTAEWELDKYNWLQLNLEGANAYRTASYREGQIRETRTLRRDNKTLFLDRMYYLILEALKQEGEITKVIALVTKSALPLLLTSERELNLHILEVLEAMITEGWIVGSVVSGLPFVKAPVCK